MTWNIRLFAAAAEAAGTAEIGLQDADVAAARDANESAAATGGSAADTGETRSDATISDIRRALARHAPALQELLTRSWFAVNGQYAPDDRATVRPGDEIAVIPPVSGGATPPRSPEVAVVLTVLDPADMFAAVASAHSGAVVVFAGTVREWTRGRQTLRLEYEAYDEMAVAKLREVTAACKERWPIDRICIWHRVGVLEIGETSLLVGVSTPHRKDAYAAAEFAVNTLKRIVPIWKKEWYANGEVQWVGPEGPWNPVQEGNDS